MADKIVVGPITKGQKTDRPPFVIDNDSFPKLINAYQWRGRILRKRGTAFLGRLTRFFNSTVSSYSSTVTINLVAGAANILTGFSLQTNGNIVPGSVTITDINTGDVYTDLAIDGTLVGVPAGTGTINYSTGAITITGGGADLINVIFRYTPDLPVMGLRELALDPSDFSGTLAFDTTYSYNILTTDPYNIYDVSFYKNPAVSASLPGYIPKATPTPTAWNGKNYQQFWTTNYQGALWATNGINVPFNITNIGMQFKPITTVTVTAGGPPAIATLHIIGHGLIVGDFLFVNEVATTTGINLQTGYVIAILGPDDISVEFPNATLVGNGAGGIAQYLTNRSDPTKDSLRWYDGDPTNANAANPTFVQGHGWVNFSPPLSRSLYTIADLPAAIYYLVGARLIVPFKDRLLFFGPVVQTSSASPNPIYLPDTVIYSQNGTPYYTASFTKDPSLPTTIFNLILVPDNQTAVPRAYWGDQTGFGGWLQTGIAQPIITAIPNEDVLIVGFPKIQARLVYSGNDIVPFNFFLIDSELSTSSTFSGINIGYGVITRGDRGIIVTTQREASRLDLDILPDTFEISQKENGTERFTAQRDYLNEWIYFTYPSNSVDYIFPNQTLQYNYRESTWATFNESYTTYGQFRRKTGLTWVTLNQNDIITWNGWNIPWNSGSTTLLNPEVIAGNQQGFVIFRDQGTNESNSLYIQSLSGLTITSPDHCLNNGDYIIISGALGVSNLNGRIFAVSKATTNTFVLVPSGASIPSGTYLGRGLIKRMYVPFIQTKQFPVAWGMGRKTRIGVQQYLLTSTVKGQIQLLIFLSQDAAEAYNQGNVVPQINVVNNSLIYSTVLFTCPESTNLGLTPANSSLMMITDGAGASQQSQIWHRVNTSLVGDTIQLGFTMSDTQMRDIDFNNQFVEIELFGFNMDVSPSQILA